ncbi:hypothetical protein BOX15_Mlig006192g5 [Macrostomum lignano]|uniref:Exonuclease domain-containing protein n=1 Tax=Macrostomum lignano TaxID=282301 RepID=A0A267DKQ7_9PLAT|nr:hypothetical protein BOX15_Mlig006192g5 [Macrostomum lignano]
MASTSHEKRAVGSTKRQSASAKQQSIGVKRARLNIRNNFFSRSKALPIIRTNIVRLDEPNLATQVVAIDCEFVGTGPRGSVSALGRASVLNERGDVLLDVMCLPDEPVTDYRTRWSGIRAADLSRGLPFDAVQDLVRRAVRGRVLVGHALHNDLRVLRLHHPEGLVRDTSKCVLLQAKAGMPPQGKRPASLRSLSLALLNLRIQQREHDSVEDADACLKLYHLVAEEWESQLGVRAPELGKESDDGSDQASNGDKAAASVKERQRARLHELSYSNPESTAKLTARRQVRPGFVGTWQTGDADNLLVDDKYW